MRQVMSLKSPGFYSPAGKHVRRFKLIEVAWVGFLPPKKCLLCTAYNRRPLPSKLINSEAAAKKGKRPITLHTDVHVLCSQIRNAMPESILIRNALIHFRSRSVPLAIWPVLPAGCCCIAGPPSSGLLAARLLLPPSLSLPSLRRPSVGSSVQWCIYARLVWALLIGGKSSSSPVKYFPGSDFTFREGGKALIARFLIQFNLGSTIAERL